MGEHDPRPLEASKALLLIWMIIPGRATRFSSSPLVALLWYITGLLVSLLGVRGRMRYQRAGPQPRREGSVGMPASVRRALGAEPPSSAAFDVLAWLAGQIQIFVGGVAPAACVYALGGRSKVYIGYTGNAHEHPGTRHLGLPARRTGEHLRDLLVGRTGPSLHTSRKSCAWTPQVPCTYTSCPSARGGTC